MPTRPRCKSRCGDVQCQRPSGHTGLHRHKGAILMSWSVPKMRATLTVTK